MTFLRYRLGERASVTALPTSGGGFLRSGKGPQDHPWTRPESLSILKGRHYSLVHLQCPLGPWPTVGAPHPMNVSIRWIE